MKKVLAFLFLGLTACNFDAGECHLRSEEGAGAGGGVITPAGAGGFGDVPPEPQDATDPPPPECNIVKDSVCNEKCLTDYENEAAICGKITDDAQRTTCNDSAHARYKSCRNNCTQKENDCLDHCKDLCVEIWENCDAGCGKDHVCKEKCIQKLIACNEKCEEKCK
jgi:hypothetical protein